MTPRLAAGAGAVLAFVFLSGPGAAEASARPGDSRDTDRGHSSDRGGGGSHNRKPDNDRRGYGNGNRSDNGNRGDGTVSSRGSAPESRVGSGRDDVARSSSSSRSAATTDSASSARSASANASADESAASGESIAGEAPVVSAPVPSGAVGASSTGGPDASSAPASIFERPQVRAGNGRAPGMPGRAPEPHWQAPAPIPAEPMPPMLPPPGPAPAGLQRADMPPAVVRQFATVPGVPSADPLWGIAGLLLIPVAGAALGYRQARAAQAAQRMHRS